VKSVLAQFYDSTSRNGVLITPLPVSFLRLDFFPDDPTVLLRSRKTVQIPIASFSSSSLSSELLRRGGFHLNLVVQKYDPLVSSGALPVSTFVSGL
jgi:hypothetical protein